jgi:hypothetical protein
VAEIWAAGGTAIQLRRLHVVLALLLAAVLFVFSHADLLERSAEDR